MSADKKDEKHVIILGAGASASSRIPLAEELRYLMTSKIAVHEAIYKERLIEQELFSENRVDDLRTDIKIKFDVLWKEFSKEIQLFRRGAFGTVDEFCRLSRDEGLTVQRLKQLMKFCLLIRSPELLFHKSDYYSFAQRLFYRDTAELNPNISVLSFNYDPHLDMILSSAYMTRCLSAKAAIDPAVLNALNGGLLSGSKGSLKAEGFSLLKLHGTVVAPVRKGGNLEVNGLLQERCQERLDKLLSLDRDCNPVPVVFPWELFLSADEFYPVKDCHWNLKLRDAQEKEFDLWETMTTVWACARTLVERADKVSFIGLSLHPYLDCGMRYLFGGKTGKAQVVLADPVNVPFRSKYDLNRLGGTPVNRYQRFLNEISEFEAKPSILQADAVNPSGITPRDSFRDFIDSEMPLDAACKPTKSGWSILPEL